MWNNHNYENIQRYFSLTQTFNLKLGFCFLQNICCITVPNHLQRLSLYQKYNTIYVTCMQHEAPLSVVSINNWWSFCKKSDAKNLHYLFRKKKNATRFLEMWKYVCMSALNQQQCTKQDTNANFKFINNTFKKCWF